MKYSVVVPIYEEAGNIAKLDKEIREAMRKVGTFETIYVNDGSKDNSLKELHKLKHVVIVDLNRNYGQSTAMDAGFRVATGDIIITMDGDLQNDPADIPKMVKKLQDENLDVVAGWRKNRKDKGGIRVLTRTGRLLRKILIKDQVHDTGCTLRVYRKEAAKSLDLQGEMHRYILALLKWKGFRIGEMVVNHRPRVHGVAKYGYSKAVRGMIDLVYIWFIQKYSQRPLHAFGYFSLFSGFVGALSFLWSIYEKIFLGLGFNRSGFFFLGIFLIMMALVSMGFGIIIDLLIKNTLNSSPIEKRYYIREVVRK